MLPEGPVPSDHSPLPACSKFPSAPRQWGQGPVTLLGDAMHPAGPAGQGFGMAAEDAHQLGLSIGQLGPTAGALRDYEQARAER